MTPLYKFQFVKICRIFWNERHSSYVNCYYHCFPKTKVVFLNRFMVFFQDTTLVLLLSTTEGKISSSLFSFVFFLLTFCLFFFFWNVVFGLYHLGKMERKEKENPNKQHKAKSVAWYSIYRLVLVQISIDSMLFRKYFLDSLAWGIRC